MLNLTGTSSNVDVGLISNALKDHYGIPLQKLQDESTIKAMNTPAQFIADRQLKIDELFNAKSPLTLAYAQAFATYSGDERAGGLGLPENESKQLAFLATQSLYEANVKALELRYPGGYQHAMQTASINHNASLAKAVIADPGIGDQVKSKDAQHYRRKLKKIQGKGI